MANLLLFGKEILFHTTFATWADSQPGGPTIHHTLCTAISQCATSTSCINEYRYTDKDNSSIIISELLAIFKILFLILWGMFHIHHIHVLLSQQILIES